MKIARRWLVTRIPIVTLAAPFIAEAHRLRSGEREIIRIAALAVMLFIAACAADAQRPLVV